MKYFFATIILFLIFSMSALPFLVSAQSSGRTSGLVPCGNVAGDQCDFNDLLQLGLNLIKYLIYISIPLAAISFAWAGFLYLSSGGDTGKVDKAKGIFWKVLIGFLFVISAWLIVYVLVSLLDPSFSLLKPN